MSKRVIRDTARSKWSISQNMPTVIINADDYGLTNGICGGIHALFGARALSSTTLMPAVAGIIEKCERWGVRRIASHVGVHLQLTGGRPLLGHHVPSLADSSGYFRSKDDLTGVSLAEVEAEWRAQIELVRSILGQKPSHLDTHHGVHKRKRLGEVLAELAHSLQMPVRDRRYLQSLSKHRLAGSDIVLEQWSGTGMGADRLKEDIKAAVASASSSHVIEIAVHPGYADEELQAASSWVASRPIEIGALAELARTKWFESQKLLLASSWANLDQQVA